MSKEDHSRPPPPYTPPNHNYYYSSSHEKGLGAHPQASAPPPPGLYPTPPQMNSARSQIGTPVIIYNHTQTFGPYPQRATCPKCNADVMTETHSTPGLLTYILNGLVAVVCFPCFLLPCCIRECKDIEHRCPNCRHKLGLYTRI